MPKFKLVILLITLQFNAFSQVSDMISVRTKWGKVVRVFTSGTNIQLITRDGEIIKGPVRIIKNDTVYIEYFNIEKINDYSGFVLRDTLGIFDIKVAFADIKGIRIKIKKDFQQISIPRILTVAGLGYMGLNVINGLILDEPIIDKYNLKRLSIAGAAAATGIIWSKKRKKPGYSTGRHKLIYLRLN